jgi:hypothetical protein
MERPDPAGASRDVDDLKRRIDQWRMTHRQRRPMPEDLWQEAARIARVRGINPTASALGLNYYGLKERTEGLPKEAPAPAARPAFVRVEAPPALFPATCEVEVESRGEKLTLRISGSPPVDVHSLLNAFWSRRR